MVQTFQSRKLSNLCGTLAYHTLRFFIFIKMYVFIVSVLIQYPNENRISISKGKQKAEIYEFIWEIIRPLIRGIHIFDGTLISMHKMGTTIFLKYFRNYLQHLISTDFHIISNSNKWRIRLVRTCTSFLIIQFLIFQLGKKRN